MDVKKTYVKEPAKFTDKPKKIHAPTRNKNMKKHTSVALIAAYLLLTVCGEKNLDALI